MRDLSAVIGAVLVSVGAGVAWLPAGLIVGGALLLIAAVWGHVRGAALPIPPSGPAPK
jgi:hypothetical protein